MTSPDPLDAYIDAVSAALDLPIEEVWRDAVRANLKVTLMMARRVEEFALPDTAEPAPIYMA